MARRRCTPVLVVDDDRASREGLTEFLTQLRNWRFWEPACGTLPAGTLPIRYVVANPDVNRPDGSEAWFPSGLFFFASGVALLMAFIFRRSETDDGADWRGMLHG